MRIGLSWRANAQSGLFQTAQANPGGGIARAESHLSTVCKLFKETESPLNISDGAVMLTRIRDDLVHPVMKMNVSMEAYSEARRVGQWYVELLLLKLFNYRGSYKNRLTQQWEVVPWAQGADCNE